MNETLSNKTSLWWWQSPISWQAEGRVRGFVFSLCPPDLSLCSEKLEVQNNAHACISVMCSDPSLTLPL